MSAELAIKATRPLAAMCGEGGKLWVTEEGLRAAALRGRIAVVGPECHCTPGYACKSPIAIHRTNCPLKPAERNPPAGVLLANGPTMPVHLRVLDGQGRDQVTRRMAESDWIDDDNEHPIALQVP